MHGVATEFSLEDMCRLSYRSVCVHPCMAAGASGLVASPSATYHTVLCKSGRHGTRTRIARTTGSAGTTDALALPVRARTKAIFIVSSRTYSSPVQAIWQTRTPEREIEPIERATSCGHACARRASSPSVCLVCVCQCHLLAILPASQKRQYSFALAARTASILPAGHMCTLRCFESCPEWTDQIQAKDFACLDSCTTESSA